MAEERASGWVFDRPLYADALFWVGVTVGVVLVVLEASAEQFNELSVLARIIAVVFRFLVGLFLVGVVGGSARNFVRGYRHG